jgi:hypothetical protein
MQEQLIEEFIIPATSTDFRNWLTSYGEATEDFFAPFDVINIKGKTIWYYSLWNKGVGQLGTVLFESKTEQPELLTVTVYLRNKLVTDINGVERWMLKDKPGLIERFRELTEAIREKYKITAPITKADPPWDRLAEKARWAPDDWVYFFDCLIPEPKRGIHTSPDFADLSKLTDDFTNNRKAESYIERKYGEYRTHKNSRKKLP